MKLLTLLLLSLPAFGLPIFTPDSVTVPLTDPRISQYVYAVPGSTWYVYLNDNPIGSKDNDWDFNDGIIRLQFDAQNFLSGYWLGSNSAWTNQITVEGVSLSASNVTMASPVAFIDGYRLDITGSSNVGYQYVIGTQNFLTEQVPEPGTWALMGAGLLAVGWLRRGR